MAAQQPLPPAVQDEFGVFRHPGDPQPVAPAVAPAAVGTIGEIIAANRAAAEQSNRAGRPRKRKRRQASDPEESAPAPAQAPTHAPAPPIPVAPHMGIAMPMVWIPLGAGGGSPGWWIPSAVDGAPSLYFGQSPSSAPPPMHGMPPGPTAAQLFGVPLNPGQLPSGLAIQQGAFHPQVDFSPSLFVGGLGLVTPPREPLFSPALFLGGLDRATVDEPTAARRRVGTGNLVPRVLFPPPD